MPLTNQEIQDEFTAFKEENKDSHNQLYDKADVLNREAGQTEEKLKNNKERTLFLEKKIDGFSREMGVVSTELKSVIESNKTWKGTFVAQLLVVVGLLILLYLQKP